MSNTPAGKPIRKRRNISGDLTKIISELSASFFERREIMEALLLCLLAKSHGFLLGPPGTGKSALIEALCDRIDGSNYFSVLFDRQLGKEDVFGPLDMAKIRAENIWQRDTEGYLPWAHIVFGDEVGKAGPATLNQLLWAMNERKDRNGKQITQIPLISFFGASNEFLEPELAALWDRFLVRVDVDYIQNESKFTALMSTAVQAAPTSTTTVALADLEFAIERDIPEIPIPPDVMTAIIKLRAALKLSEITPSDRRWKQSARLLQASAYLNGRSTVEEDDLLVLENVLWETKEQVSKVRQEVRKVTSEVNRRIIEVEQMLGELMANTKAQAGLSTEKRANFGTDTKHKLEALDAELRTMIEQANRTGRTTNRLEQTREQSKFVLVEVYVTCLNMTPERARSKVFGN